MLGLHASRTDESNPWWYSTTLEASQRSSPTAMLTQTRLIEPSLVMRVGISVLYLLFRHELHQGTREIVARPHRNRPCSEIHLPREPRRPYIINYPRPEAPKLSGMAIVPRAAGSGVWLTAGTPHANRIRYNGADWPRSFAVNLF